MQVVIMAGGRGERIESLFPNVPKALLPVGDTCLLEKLITNLKSAGADEIIICTGYLSEKISTFLNQIDQKIILVKEDSPQGTVGAIGNITHLLDDDFLVVNCDVVADFPYQNFFKNHLDSESKATVAITTVEHELRYGLVTSNNFDMITSIEEKPVIKFPVMMGIYSLNLSSVTPYLGKNLKMDMTDLLKMIIQNTGSINRYNYSGPWIDIGTPVDFMKLNELTYANH